MTQQIGEAMAEALLAEAEETFLAAETRSARRAVGCMAVLASDNYVYLRCCMPLCDIAGPEPSEQITKRQWEKRMEEWRIRLRALRILIESQ